MRWAARSTSTPKRRKPRIPWSTVVPSATTPANCRQTASTSDGQGIDISYDFPSANNGRVQSITDHVTGEQVTYTYDQLNPLIQAVSTTREP